MGSCLLVLFGIVVVSGLIALLSMIREAAIVDSKEPFLYGDYDSTNDSTLA